LDDFSLFYQKFKPLQRSTSQLPLIEILLRLKGNVSDQWILPNDIFEFSGQNKIKSKIDFWVLKKTINWLQDNQGIQSRFSHYTNNPANAVLCEMLKKLADLSDNTIIAKPLVKLAVS
jgi:EAL domain-containing protein (putative c-di-GMP-specific phosphodiesterase class I)